MFHSAGSYLLSAHQRLLNRQKSLKSNSKIILCFIKIIPTQREKRNTKEIKTDQHCWEIKFLKDALKILNQRQKFHATYTNSMKRLWYPLHKPYSKASKEFFIKQNFEEHICFSTGYRKQKVILYVYNSSCFHLNYVKNYISHAITNAKTKT